MNTDNARSLVTVLVSCCGQLEFTRLCVPSLLRFCRQPYELFFLDSDSLDGTKEYLEGLASAAPVRVEVIQVSMEGPKAARKDDLISVKGDYLALLNNDVLVTQNWLEKLTQLANSDPAIGMVAPMSNYAQAELLVDPVPYSLEEFLSDSNKRASAMAAVDKVNGFAREWAERQRSQTFEPEQIGGGCALLKKEVIQKMGQFPSRTPLGTFDLVTLSQRVRQVGYRLAGAKDVFIHSFGARGNVRR